MIKSYLKNLNQNTPKNSKSRSRGVFHNTLIRWNFSRGQERPGIAVMEMSGRNMGSDLEVNGGE
jgi:hypothetical protein